MMADIYAMDARFGIEKNVSVSMTAIWEQKGVL